MVNSRMHFSLLPTAKRRPSGENAHPDSLYQCQHECPRESSHSELVEVAEKGPALIDCAAICSMHCTQHSKSISNSKVMLAYRFFFIMEFFLCPRSRPADGFLHDGKGARATRQSNSVTIRCPCDAVDDLCMHRRYRSVGID